MLWNAWNWLWNFITNVQSIAFGLSAALLLLGLAWGKSGLKRLNKKREAQVFLLAGWSAVVYLGCLAFVVIVQFITYLWRLLPGH